MLFHLVEAHLLLACSPLTYISFCDNSPTHNEPPLQSYLHSLALFTLVRGIGILGSCARPCNPSYLFFVDQMGGTRGLAPPFEERGWRMKKVLAALLVGLISLTL